ncbi:MAG: Crp/Fnr family transcriptional regulator [Woeseiaceae bacterium]|nr:Crp/Fnr family transcriptional regulator [Woeseiaceae bacterium]
MPTRSKESDCRQLLADSELEVAALGDATIERLLARATCVELEQGRFVFHAGDQCRAFLVLLEGRVRVQLTSAAGREVTLYRIQAGGSCVLTTSCLLGSENYPAEAIAEAPIRALAIPLQDFHSVIEKSPEFRNFVFDGFSSRLTNVIRKIEQIAFTAIDARLAAALLEKQTSQIDRVTHQELAVELGTAREVVSRHLKRFEALGLVELGRGRVSLLNLDKLASIAAPAFGD